MGSGELPIATATSRGKGTYRGAQYHRRAARRGKKRAILAVAHNMLVIGYHLIERNCPYRELGPDYLYRLHQARLERSWVR